MYQSRGRSLNTHLLALFLTSDMMSSASLASNEQPSCVTHNYLFGYCSTLAELFCFSCCDKLIILCDLL